MRVGSILSLCLLSVLTGVLGGCASNGSGSGAADSAVPKKGHWITLPPETGSMISRRVWVEDNGQSTTASSVNNLQTGSATSLQRLQNPGSLKPSGS